MQHGGEPVGGSSRYVAIAAGIVYLVAMSFVAMRDDLRHSAWPTIFASLVASGAVLALAASASRSVVLDANRIDCGVPSIFALALIARVALLLPQSGLSDDFNRYVWEGRVVLAGENPYQLAPDDPALVALRDQAIWPSVTHKEVPAAYPPLAQSIFAFAAATPWPIGFLRILFSAGEFLAWIVVARVLARRAGSVVALLLLLLTPLSILEYAGSMHFDSLAVLGMVLAWAGSERERPLIASGWLALATLVKPFPVLLFPLIARRQTLARQALLFAAIVSAAHLPFCGDGIPYRGLLRYAEEWSFNAPIYTSVLTVVRACRDFAFDHQLMTWPWVGRFMRNLVDQSPERSARVILAVAFACLATIQYWPRRLETRSNESRALRVLLALLLCSPVVHPWYVTWLMPVAAFAFRDPLAKSVWLWAALAPLGYHVLPEFVELGIWREDRVWRALQYAPVLVSIAWVSLFSTKSGVAAGDGGGADRRGRSDANPAQ